MRSHDNDLPSFKANMMSGEEEEEASGDEGSETPDDLLSSEARPRKVLGVDPTTELNVCSTTSRVHV